MQNHIHRRYHHVCHPALAARVHLATTDRDAGDLESLCGGRSQGWELVTVEPGREEGCCTCCLARRAARERWRAQEWQVRGEDGRWVAVEVPRPVVETPG